MKNSKEIEDRICEGVLAVLLQKKTEALLWKLPVELFISRTFLASLFFNCVLKICPERQSTTCPEACPSDRETRSIKIWILRVWFPEDTYSGFHKITGFVLSLPQQASGFTESLVFKSHLWMRFLHQGTCHWVRLQVGYRWKNSLIQAGELRFWSRQSECSFLWFLSPVSDFCQGLMAGQVLSFWPFSAVLLWFDGSVTKKVSFEEEAMEEFSAKQEWMKITGSVWQ